MLTENRRCVMWLWLNSLWRKLKWVIKLVYTFVSPIYEDVLAIIKQVKAEGLKDDEARKEVFQRVTDVIQKKGLDIPDSTLNAIIECVYQLVKWGRV